MLMQDLEDPARPSAWFQINRDGTPCLVVTTRTRIMFLPAPGYAKAVVWWCRMVHRRFRSFQLPAAGAFLWWPVKCDMCGCRYEVKTPHGYETPWRKKAGFRIPTGAGNARTR